MSPRYEQEITDLSAWFETAMDGLPSITMTEAQYSRGTDALPEGEYCHLVAKAFSLWLNDRNYELSYNQICNAFFTVGTKTEKVKIIS